MRTVKWGPRTIDLDILLYDEDVIEMAELTVPHPLMHEREFVLTPLSDIAPTHITRYLRRRCRNFWKGLKSNIYENHKNHFRDAGLLR